MGKIPHKDFAPRRVLDGSEEIYTQHEDYTPTEQKFTLTQLVGYVLSQITLQQAMGKNGLNGTGNLELGGTLLKKTIIDTAEFDLLLQKAKLQFGLTEEDKEGNRSIHFYGENENGNWGFIGIGEDGQIRILSKTPDGNTKSQLVLSPTLSTLSRANSESETKVSQQGSVLTLQSQNQEGLASFIRVDILTGIHFYDPNVLKFEVGENGEIRLITPKVNAGNAPIGSIPKLANLEGKIEFQKPNQSNIKTVTADYSVAEEDVTLILNASTQSFNLTLPDATQNEGVFYNLISRFDTANAVNVSAQAGKLVQGTTESATIQIQNAPDTRTFQSDGKDWILISRY